MKKSSKIKKIIFSLLIAIGLCLVCKYTVNADDRSYKVQNANFDVHFKTDGSAVVTEQWTVDFKGDYTRFYKDIHYTDLAKVEEFSDIIFKPDSIYINGNSCTKAVDDSRKSYTYNIDDNGENYRIEWFYGAHNETVTYEITYKLNNLITLSDNNKAIFVYRFIGEDFNDNIQNVNVSIKSPKNSSIELKYCNVNGRTSEVKNKSGEDILKFNCTNHRHLLKVNVAMDSEYFTDCEKHMTLEEIRQEAESRNTQQSSSGTKNLTILDIIGSQLLILLFIGFLIFSSFISVRFSNRRKNKINMQINSIMQKYDDISPVGMILIVNKNINNISKFVLVQILYYMHRRAIQYIPNHKTFVFRSDNINLGRLELKYYNQIGSMFGFNRELRNNDIINIIYNSENTIKKLIKEYRKDINRIIRSKGIITRITIKKDAKKLNEWAKNNTALTSEVNQEMINNNVKYVTVVELCYNNSYDNDTGFDDDDGDDDKSIFDLLRDLLEDKPMFVDNSHNNSGSGCSSCSSCSSCGGCGGGGAD